MTGDSSKRVAVVTGGCNSIGQAIALEFAKEGYCITINGVERQLSIMLPRIFQEQLVTKMRALA
jgi:NAD(P)-dependent dehydrogenase (short-subunit alcohol dehydrogenase family)